MPRIRDFRGLSTRSFDGRGNYSLGVKEQMIFPEINYDMVEQIHGMDITFVTTAPGDDHALALLQGAGHAVPRRTTRTGAVSDLSRGHRITSGQSETAMARKAMIEKSKRKPKFAGPGAQPVRPLRALARVSAPLRTLPHLLPRAGAVRDDPRRAQSELVARIRARVRVDACVGTWRSNGLLPGVRKASW